MFIISQPCSLELCLYKVKRGNFGITVQKYQILKLYIKLYIVQAEKQTMMPQAV